MRCEADPRTTTRTARTEGLSSGTSASPGPDLHRAIFARMVAVGDVYAFTANRLWVPCQVIGTVRKSWWRVIVFDALSKQRPEASIVDGAPIYTLRYARPRNEPLYLACEEDPPAAFKRLGHRNVELAFALPKTFRTSPTADEDTLPVFATWAYAKDRVKDDLAKRPPGAIVSPVRSSTSNTATKTTSKTATKAASKTATRKRR